MRSGTANVLKTFPHVKMLRCIFLMDITVNNYNLPSSLKRGVPADSRIAINGLRRTRLALDISPRWRPQRNCDSNCDFNCYSNCYCNCDYNCFQMRRVVPNHIVYLSGAGQLNSNRNLRYPFSCQKRPGPASHTDGCYYSVSVHWLYLQFSLSRSQTLDFATF